EVSLIGVVVDHALRPRQRSSHHGWIEIARSCHVRRAPAKSKCGQEDKNRRDPYELQHGYSCSAPLMAATTRRSSTGRGRLPVCLNSTRPFLSRGKRPARCPTGLVRPSLLGGYKKSRTRSPGR